MRDPCVATQSLRRTDSPVRASEIGGGRIDGEAYATFRHDLLRHIAMEEKVLLPFVRAKRGGEALAVATSLRADHGEIAKLTVHPVSQAATEHWFDPCELLKPDARSEYRAEFRERQCGGGWVPRKPTA